MRLAMMLAALLAPNLAAAEGIDIVDGLADLIAAEAFCGLRYDQQAIETFIAQNVAADDLEFTGLLKGLTFAADASQQRMSQSAATAHCAHIRRLAQHHGFTDR